MQAELELAALRQEYDALLENLKWSHVLVSVLVENEGGIVEIPQEELESYPINGTVRVTFDAEALVYRIETIPADIDGESE